MDSLVPLLMFTFIERLKNVALFLKGPNAKLHHEFLIMAFKPRKHVCTV